MASVLPAAGILPATKVRTRNESALLKAALMKSVPAESVLESGFMRRFARCA
ncbi:MAG: hypothetical protein JF591_07810 [Lysobacter sp.]|nr:hypothetical protein [Lysobacter sp.]